MQERANAADPAAAARPPDAPPPSLAAENAQLRAELAAAQRRQAATADILRIISRSPGDLQAVLQRLTESAATLCGADMGSVTRRIGDVFVHVADYRFPPGWLAAVSTVALGPGRGSVVGRALLEGRTVQVADVLADPEYTYFDQQKVAGYRTFLAVPLLRDGQTIGVLAMCRTTVAPFTTEQEALVETFADQAVIAIENARLFDEVEARTAALAKALEQQTATAGVLKAISRSTFDLQTVLDTLVESAARLCRADMAWLFQSAGDHLRFTASFSDDPGMHARLREFFAALKVPIDRGSVTGRTALEGTLIHIPDVAADPEYRWAQAQRIGGYRACIGVPLLREGAVAGVIFVGRTRVEPFGDDEIALVTTFADQAVIAIENARLFDEVKARTEDLTESLQQQTATADVLKVISRSTFDVQTVLNALAESAGQLCQADNAQIFLRDGQVYRLSAHNGFSAAYQDYARRHPIAPGRGTLVARTALEGRAIHIPDATADPEYTWREGQQLAGFRSMLGMPLLREGDCIGVMALTRSEPRPFSAKQIALVETYADQAVIAIENARLFGEVKARTDDLSEALTQQTATADVLKVISRSAFDLQTVFDTVAESAVSLCDADKAFIFRFDGERLQVAAAVNVSAELRAFITANPIRPGRHSGAARCALERRTVHIEDAAADADYTYGARAVDPIRTVLAVPMLKDDQLLGVILVYHLDVQPFTAKQISLIETFADQAVIAIENVRLFDEVKARTRELSAALDRQTATAEILGVISRSPGELEAVFQAMLANAMRLCEARFGILFAFEDGRFRALSTLGVPDGFATFLREPRTWAPDTGMGQVAATLQPVQILDVHEGRASAERIAVIELGGVRTVAIVPMLKDAMLTGAIAVFRQEVRAFGDDQIDLLRSFADQAVIAIENARLLDELRESLQRQTATAEVLKVISRSTFDLQMVLRTLVESATRLCAADKGTITRQRDGKFYRAESYGFSEEFMALVRDMPVDPDRGTGSGRALLEGRVVHIADVRADPEYTLADAQRLDEFRTLLSVPMLKEGVAIGVLTLTRSTVDPFTAQQIELVSTFADQAAIAIENVRLFESVQARTRELARSLEDLRTAQDRLVQTEKLASLGQLTAGIAHEIKNPLNFVNNFAAVSGDLVDELQQLLEAPALDASRRAEIGEIAGMLKDNLAKVVQHGKRADSIVKNMLLHSREGTGERRVVEVNALVDEAVNLAYHGARAENRDFNVTLERVLDPAAGTAAIHPQEITRVLLNLIANGFYAAARRKAAGAEPGWQPTLSAATRDLGDAVEIRIRDNGTGIPPEVRDKIFNPFFTTKPPGEGTGLGLSISHDIVVKQHGGTIAVDTEPGRFTEFRLVLPRAGGRAAAPPATAAP